MPRLTALLKTYGGTVWAGILSLVAIVLGPITSLTRVSGAMFEPYAWRSVETARFLEDYYYNGYSLMRTPVGWLGRFALQAYECPLIYLPVLGLYRVFGLHPILGKLYLFAFYPVSFVYLYRLVRRYTDPAWAALSVACYALFPLSIFYSVSLQIDYLVVTAVLGASWHVLRYNDTGKVPHLLGFSAWFLLGAIEKPPYFLLVGPLLIWSFLRDFRLPRIAALAGAAVPGLALFAWWTRLSNQIDKLKPQSPIFPAGLHSNNWNRWYYGTWDQRIAIKNWDWMLSHLFEGFTWIALLLALAAFVWLAIQRNTFALLLCLGYALLIGIFFNLYLIHDYYHSIGAVALAVLCGFGFKELLARYKAVGLGLFIAFLFRSQFQINTHYFQRNANLEEIAGVVHNATLPDDVVLFVHDKTEFHDPRLPYWSHRYGLNLHPEDITPQILTEARKFGVTTVATINAFGFKLPEPTLSRDSTLTAHRHAVIVYRLTPTPKDLPRYY